MIRYLFLSILFLETILFCSCIKEDSTKTSDIVEKWMDKEIIFPSELEFSLYGKTPVFDTIPKTKYKIVTYIDSVSCSNCTLRLSSWMKFIDNLKTLNLNVPILFIIHPSNIRVMKATLMSENFSYPICLDVRNRFNSINNLPNDISYQTFLLDSLNHVIAIGNPAHNYKIKEFFIDILASGKDKKSENRTNISIQSSIIDLGYFKQIEKDTTIYIKNVGKTKLMIFDVLTSCGCTLVDYGKKPVQPNDSIAIKIKYHADKEGTFNKIINIYCNIKESYIRFNIRGTKM